MFNKKRSIINGFIIGIVILILLGIFLPRPKPSMQSSESPQAVLIGGAFELIDQNGAPKTNLSFHDQYMLIYFGYSFCPDVCPIDLQKISMALSTLDEEGMDTSDLQPLFITIDPERDTPENLNEYMKNFHPKILALSGSVEAIKTATKAYRVYVNKGEVNEDGSYLMDHSSIIYLMGKRGEYIDHFSPDISPTIMADKIKLVLTSDQ